jgi:hypothetical protein
VQRRPVGRLGRSLLRHRDLLVSVGQDKPTNVKQCWTLAGNPL